MEESDVEEVEGTCDHDGTLWEIIFCLEDSLAYGLALWEIYVFLSQEREIVFEAEIHHVFSEILPFFEED